jgi:antitoxin (DNA-binding transcriptional repressor) of toxin-antitoxin stability system
MRKLFELLSIFDWITPTIAIAQDVAEGGPFNLDAWTFYIPYDAAIQKDWPPARIEKLLAQHGVKTWGSLVHFGEFFFRTKLEQAQWAEYILTRYGVPIADISQGAPRPTTENKGNGQQTQTKSKRPAARRVNWTKPLDEVADFLTRLSQHQF